MDMAHTCENTINEITFASTMPRTLVIAEKPAMGRDIANALSKQLGQPVQDAGLGQRVGSITVVGAIGHLLELAEPEQYDQKFAFPWQLETLPCMPEQLRWEPKSKKDKGKKTPDAGVLARLKYIGEALKSADEVVHAGDPDREGQLIVDNLLRRYRWTGPTKRLWLHAQTEQGIRDAWRQMKSNADQRMLGLSALCRAEADWCVGMNGTRAYSTLWWKRGHKGILNLGRVMTPVIGMIVQREHDIRAFVPVDHFGIVATIEVPGKPPFQATWQRPQDSEGRPEFDPTGTLLLSREFAQTIARACSGKPAKLQVIRQQKADAPPLLFSLTELQKAAAKLGYSPDAVLQAAQALYETHKLTSYPRTDCQYAPTDQWPKADKTIAAICTNLGQPGQPFKFKAPLDPTVKSAAWDDSKLKEHFAIIPLPVLKPIADLPRRDADIYSLIVRQYVAQFSPKHCYWSTTVLATIEGQLFKATGKTVTSEGWRALFGATEEQEDKLPDLQDGSVGVANPVQVKAKKTEPPKRFTSITLLDAMEKAWQFVTEPAIKKRLKQVEGLGTSATRAPLIAKIIQHEFVLETKSGKVITYVPTPKAEVYIKCVPPKLAAPDLTAYFEGLLEDVKEGRMTYENFRAELSKLVLRVVLGSALDGSAIANMPAPDHMPEQAEIKRTRAPRKTRT